MSMNLYCNGFDVIQTPTYITYMIYDDGAGGMDAVKRRYINYIKYLRQDQFNKANKQEEILNYIGKTENLTGIEVDIREFEKI